MDKKLLLLMAGVISSVVSIYFGLGVIDKLENSLVWFFIFVVPPASGIFKLYRFKTGKRMTLHLISAEPDERDKRVLIATIALFFTIVPVLMAIKLAS